SAAVSGFTDVADHQTGSAFSVTFGGAGHPGLSIDAAGQVTGFDASITSSFHINRVQFTTDNLTLTYTPSPANGTQDLNLSGTAKVAIGGLKNDAGNDELTVTFGEDGLQLNGSGQLLGLDVSINGSFTVNSVKITAEDLNLKYAPSSAGSTGGAYSLSGT